MSDARPRILDAASSLFRQTGYEGTTTAQIWERAKLSNGSLFNAYRTKAAIRDALICDARQRYAEEITAALKAAKASLVRFGDLLLGLIDRHLTWVEANVALSELVYGLAPAIWVFDSAGEPPDLLRPLFADLCEAFPKSIRRRPASVLIALVFGPAEMASRGWLLGPRPDSPRVFAAAFAAAAEIGFRNIQIAGTQMPPTPSMGVRYSSKRRHTTSKSPSDRGDLLKSLE
jgi:AcrR family transcriptional regulator